MKKRVLVVILCLSLVLGSVAHAAVEFSSFKMTFSNKDTYLISHDQPWLQNF